jgi:hypothetical protein
MLSLVGRPEFDGNLDQVANELSSLYRDPHDLETAANHLEALAASLRKIHSHRRLGICSSWYRCNSASTRYALTFENENVCAKIVVAKVIDQTLKIQLLPDAEQFIG